MLEFSEWLVRFADDILIKVDNLFYSILQALIDCIPILITSILELFSYACPPPPLPLIATLSAEVGAASLQSFMNTLNWFFPMQFFIYYVHFIVCALTAYLALMIVGRWLKVLN